MPCLCVSDTRERGEVQGVHGGGMSGWKWNGLGILLRDLEGPRMEDEDDSRMMRELELGNRFLYARFCLEVFLFTTASYHRHRLGIQIWKKWYGFILGGQQSRRGCFDGVNATGGLGWEGIGGVGCLDERQ